MSVEQQHSIEQDQSLQHSQESAILSMIEKKHNLQPDDKEKLKTISDKIEQSNKRSIENKNKFINSFIDNYTVQSQPGLELDLALQFIEKDIIPSQEEQRYFQADPIQYTNQLIGDIKSTKKYQNLQEATTAKKEATTAKQKTDDIKEKDEKNFFQDYDKSESNIIQAKSQNLLNNDLQFEDFNTTLIKTNDGLVERGLADSLVNILKISPDKVTDFLRYQVYLHNKPEKTATEQATAENFSSFLSSSGIDSESFFSSLGSKDVIARDEAIQESQDKNPSLATISDPKNIAQMKGIQQTTDALPPSLTGEKRSTDKLLKSFPFPKRVDKESFVISDSVIPDSDPESHSVGSKESLIQLRTSYQDLTKADSTISYPLFDNNPNTPPSSDANRNLRHIAFLHQITEDNPTITDTQFTTLMKELNIPSAPGLETPDQVRRSSQQYLAPFLTSTIENINTDIKQQAVPRYMSMIQSFLSGTPGLENFLINPKEVEIRPDGFTVPYRLPGHTEVCGQIENQNGNITTTNPLYDEGNTDSVTNIIFGTVGIGKVKTLQDYHTEISNKITPEDFLSALDSDSPENQIQTKTEEETANANDQINTELDFTKTRLNHQLAGVQVAESGFDLMRSFHGDGKDIQQTEQNSPYHEALQQYNFQGDQAKNQVINPESNADLYTITTILRNSTLGASTEENDRMKQGLQTLNTITKDPQFIANIKSKIPDSSSLSGDTKKALLVCCHPDQKNNPNVLKNLLSLLSHQSDNPQHRKIDLKKLESLVSQLQAIKTDPQQANIFSLTAERSHTLESVTDGIAKDNADQDLEKELEMA